ncbi:DUF58 domain-containing protein [Pengzhenrongella sicca]|uniref:DUF58 domain-containing protein n=1 Tax=Pengzhenrongella sicca TaxID=2819238 RepID=A0A8A4ZC74_9MICO|nr:DUF58 domain-containing protein [Pengzhenrongella sicca]QTE28995.1 DUF58 domain-containing protein [Pengzhenrongella sicca]
MPVARAFASVRRSLAPMLAVVGPAGWLVLAAALVGAWAGRRLGWLEGWTLAVAGTLLLAVAVAFAIGRSSYAVTLDLGQQRVVVGNRASGELTIRNVGTRTTLPARVELPVGSGLATFRLPRLAGGAEHEEMFVLPTHRRGLVVLGPVSSVRGDPLGLLRRQVRWTDPMDLYVHPRTVSLDGASAGFLRDIEGLPTQDLSSNDIAFHALRDYVAGDDRRSIHWRTTARTGRLVVRQFEETRRSHLVVGLSTCAADYADPDELELAISVAGSIGMQAIREEKQLSVLTSRGQLRAGTAIRFLDALCLLEADERDRGLAAVGRAVGGEVPDASAVLLVGGTAVGSTSLLAASTRLPVNALNVAVRCAPGEQVSRRSLGNLVVVTLGALEQLPQVMRRVAG